jgi:hypothetical protein
MLLRIHHRRIEFWKNDAGYFAPETASEKIDAGEYVVAAELKVKDMTATAALEYAFRWTNSIDRPWFEECPIGLVATGASKRSSSVGDIFEIDGDAFYLCAPLGFKPVPKKKAAPSP